MNGKKYQFGDNLIYEFENLNDEVFKSLTNILNSQSSLISIDSEDFKNICNGYTKLMMGLGKSNDLDSLLNLFDLYKDTENIIVNIKGENVKLELIERILLKVREFFNKDLNIIYGLDNTSSIYDVIICLPIIKGE
jgi:cell division GTPase FtsZ